MCGIVMGILPRFLQILTIVTLVLCTLCIGSSTELNKGKICIGTNGRMSVPSNRDHHYRNLRDRYINCTYVDGNLELTWLQDENLDLSFLQYIREVTGYVLISHVDVKRVVFPSLQIIRGRTLFKLSVADESFALLVMLSKMNTLEMPALRDILEGSVSLFNNYNLCHVKSINWTEIMSDPNAKYFYTYNFTQPQRTCHCHESCERGCWGEGSDNCQKFSKITCSPQCHDGRCYGPGPRDCCHLFCAGGCTGPTQSDCLACHNFFDDGECKQECPPMKRYNTITYSWEPNPNGKYAYGATCVRDCPGHLLKDSGACVRSCPAKKKAMDGECVRCNGPCPKTCQGVENVHSGNIDSFKGCTIIEGSLIILDHSFDGFQHVYKNFTFGEKYPEMHPNKLEVFSTLKEVTGYISIQASHIEFTNFSFLRNLEVIGGRATTEYFSSLYIVKTSLKSLGLRSLKRIRSGSVYILENNNLCFAENINWRKLIKGDDAKSQLLLQNNRAATQCSDEGLVCHGECSKDGCWDIGEDQCLSCQNYKLEERCVNSCLALNIYEKNSKECSYCHEQCIGGCKGADSDSCFQCKSVKDGPYCVDKCPETKYNANGTCESCHENCVDGCTGPLNIVGYRGCNSCKKALVNGNNEVEYCLNIDELCPKGYFSDILVRQDSGQLRSMSGNTICRKCHPKCKNCTAYGIHISVCHECTMYRRKEHCEDECPEDHYANELKKECVKCSSECSDGCTGPTESDCKACRNYRIYYEGEPSVNNTNFNCTATCPVEFPFKVFPEDISDPYCAKDHLPLSLDDENMAAILGGTLGCFFLLIIFFLVLCFLWWQRNKTKEAALKMTMTMMPYDDNEPLKPTNIKPNLAKLRIVKEAELRLGGLLGAGAFGFVNKGVWVPDGENVKIPVAIKVLKDGTGLNPNKEIFEEAYIMASVDHPNILQLLAICMTSQIMLITQLMPLGCLLDYVRNNKPKIGSKPLLNWCTQIARGMHYLEERRLVHRDLAARNVLVQTPNCVKITDFGLAKLLDYNEEEYKAEGGKMPIKWLALECIQHRIFTHKSDVWAFGVTVWELLNYGGKPYEHMPAKDVPDFLEKGERLAQPETCSMELYMLLLQCWQLEANHRPTFRELAEEFAKFSRDPGRYLVIEGDKLMRLPSYTPQDEHELIHSLSSGIDGEGVVMQAEEYLHPKYRTSHQNHHHHHNHTSSSSTSEPATPIKKIAPHFSGGEYLSGQAESPQNRQNMQRERKYAHLEAVHNSPQRPRENSLRYCSDPLKMLDTEMGDDDCFESENAGASNMRVAGYPDSSRPGYGWVGDMRLRLPLDEDDYLMPSAQANTMANIGPSQQHYMELVAEEIDNGNHHIGSNYERHNNLCHRPRIVNGNGFANGSRNGQWTGMDNPEYHLMNNAARMYGNQIPNYYAAQQTVGVPIARNCYPTYSTSSCNSGVSLSSNPTHQIQQPSSLPHGSPHEYYNEIPRLPTTPRSETTV